ncbi:MAG: helix-turn-helix domain-containing protein [Vicinamibacteraceae bacterium]
MKRITTIKTRTKSATTRTTLTNTESVIVEACARLAVNFRRLRKARGWTQAELARRSGMSVRTISRIERGQENLRIECPEDLADALSEPAHLLLEHRSV